MAGVELVMPESSSWEILCHGNSTTGRRARICVCGEAGDLTSVFRTFLIACLETDFWQSQNCKSGFGDTGLSINDSMWALLIGFYKEALRREAGAGGMWRADEEGMG